MNKYRIVKKSKFWFEVQKCVEKSVTYNFSNRGKVIYSLDKTTVCWVSCKHFVFKTLKEAKQKKKYLVTLYNRQGVVVG